MTRTFCIAMAAAAAAIILRADTAVPVDAQTKAPPAIVVRAADYLEDFDRKFSAVVSEENSEQVVHFRRAVEQTRRLRADVLLVNGGEAGWLSFRDVYEVDGVPVRDREDRLVSLFQRANGNAVDQATSLLRESARYNIGTVDRTVNLPLAALVFFRRENLSRSSFDVKQTTSVDGHSAVRINFKEEAMPRLIRTNSDRPAKGAFWVEAATGRILRTELTLEAADARGTMTVTYAPQPKLDGLWVPSRMEENIDDGANRTIRSTATYGNVRQFSSDVKIK